MKLTLRQINTEIERLCLETPFKDDETEKEIEAELRALNLAFEVKLENIANVRIEQKDYIKRLKTEKARLDREIKKVENRGKWLDLYCMGEMLRAGLRSFKGTFLKLSIRKSPVSAEVATDPDTREPRVEHIDPRFVEQVVTHKIDKKAAIAHFKNTGETPDGFRIIDNREHLTHRMIEFWVMGYGLRVKRRLVWGNPLTATTQCPLLSTPGNATRHSYPGKPTRVSYR